MLKIFHGTQLETLADRLIQELDENPPENPLRPEIFVVQNHGIGQWLSLRIAEEKGIAANLEFEFPSERIWKLIRKIDPDIPQSLPSDRQPMIWSLMSLMDDEEFLDNFGNLRRYIKDNDPVQQTVRKWKLASKIADVFDQYLIYRHDMILGWERGRSIPKTEQWQAELWNRLMKHWKESYDGQWIHRAQLKKELWNALDEGTLDDDTLPDRITVFGISSASPAFFKTMAKLSKLINLHFYHLTPNPQVTDSQNFNNPALQSLDKQGADFISQFKRSAEVQDIDQQWIDLDTTVSDKASAFKKIQADLKHDKVPDQKLTTDNSIQVHSCHSPMREVEVLYDQLLATFDEKPDLKPDDVLIMTPDIETYAPMIEAVFEIPDAGQPEIPYSIADRAIRQSNATIHSFLKILELAESRFKVTDVLDLLDASPIQEAFEFTDNDLNILEGWIDDNRIRWGVDAPFKQNLNLPESERFTWKSGLNRMLLGYAVKQEDDHLHHGIFPYSEIETSDDAVLAGKFSHFLRSLFELSKNVKIQRSASGWSEYLNQIIDNVLPRGQEYFRQVSQIRDAIEQLNSDASLGSYTHDIPFRIVRFWLEDQLEEQTTGGGRIGQGVTFSSLVPMRSIPFKMIGMIGMNEGVFPRSKIPVEFDLLHLDPQPGDPIQSEEDRHLFLENLLSARSHIYFSYVGQSNRQDSEFPPSVVLQEFLDYLKEYYDVENDEIINKHRLQAFSPHYFTDKDHFSYSQSQMDISKRLSESVSTEFFDTELPEPDREWKQLTVNDLITFFQHPIKFLLQNRLGIYLREEDVLTEDREPFSMNKLDEYNIGQELLDRFFDEQSLETYEKVLRSRNLLPEGWSGKQFYSQKAEEVKEFGHEIQQRLDQQQLEDLEVNIEIDGYRITGTLPNIYEGAQIAYRFGKARPKDKVEWWIRHLLFQQVKPRGHSGRSLLFSWDSSSLEEYSLSPVENSEEVLAELLNIYWNGLQKPLQLFCKSSYTFAENFIKEGRDDDTAIEKAIKKWEPIDTSHFYRPGECDDAYNKLVVDGSSPLKSSTFKQISCDFWQPFFEVLNKEEANV